MTKVPDVKALLAQFPWGRLESDDTFNADFARARYNVLGAQGFGYWSEPGGRQPHLPGALYERAANRVRSNRAANAQSPWDKMHEGVKDYQHGYQLHTNQHLTDVTGWLFDLDLTPRLSFDEKESMPMIATSFPGGIVDWASWYKWRKLPLKSPAALLMNYPLSVYQLLVRVLNVINPEDGSSDVRQKLVIHYLGAESELNFLPM